MCTKAYKNFDLRQPSNTLKSFIKILKKIRILNSLCSLTNPFLNPRLFQQPRHDRPFLARFSSRFFRKATICCGFSLYFLFKAQFRIIITDSTCGESRFLYHMAKIIFYPRLVLFDTYSSIIIVSTFP